MGLEAEVAGADADAVLNGGRLRARTLAPVAGNAGSYPARRTKSKRSRQTGKISACIIHGEDGHGSLSEQPTRPYGSTLSPRRNRTVAYEQGTAGCAVSDDRKQTTYAFVSWRVRRA